MQYQEIESFDRNSLKLQAIQIEATQKVLQVNKNVVVVLQNGSPSGHLAETFPIKLEDNPSYKNFGLKKKQDIDYKEGIFVGYRHYDTRNIEVLFPFGHGLSYTTFEYSNIRFIYDGDVIKFKRSQGEGEVGDDAPIIVQVDVKNPGKKNWKNSHTALCKRSIEASRNAFKTT